jgi:hypothetical protein
MIRLPRVHLGFEGTYNTWQISYEIEIHFDDVKLENRLGSIIPDVLIYKNKTPLIIEVKVTHAVDEEKRNKIKALGISAIEINLGDIDRNLLKEDLLQIILFSTDKKKWIYNEKVELIRKNVLGSSVKIERPRKGSIIDGCPINAFPFRGKKAARWTDCIHCKFCLGIDETKVNCSGLGKVGNYEEFKNSL